MEKQVKKEGGEKKLRFKIASNPYWCPFISNRKDKWNILGLLQVENRGEIPKQRRGWGR